MENDKQKEIKKLKLLILVNYIAVLYIIYSLLIGIQYVLPVCDTFGCMTITEFYNVSTGEGVYGSSGRYYPGGPEGGREEYCSQHSDFLGTDHGILSSLLSLINFLGFLFTVPFILFYILFHAIFGWPEVIDIIFRIGYAIALIGLGVYFVKHPKGAINEMLREIPDFRQKIQNLEKAEV